MNNWLAGFAYRISIHWWVFAISGVGALLTALLIVGFQAAKAALANPIVSLHMK
jgi:putative ABC transport system permease protein